MSFHRETVRASVQNAIYEVARAGLFVLWFTYMQPIISARAAAMNVPGAIAWGALVSIVVFFVVVFIVDWWRTSRPKPDPPNQPEISINATPSTRVSRADTASQILPYPAVQIFRHKEARKYNDAVFHRIHDQFAHAGWRVEGCSTDLPQHENGIRVAGKSGYEREAAKWGLEALGIDWIPDERTNPPECLQIIVGRYEKEPVVHTPAVQGEEIEKQLRSELDRQMHEVERSEDYSECPSRRS